MTTATEWRVEATPELGRVVVAPGVPEGYGLFYTTVDYGGRLRGEELDALVRFLEARWGEGIGLATCTQVHGTAIAFAQDPPTPWRELGECDALWSDRPRVALGIKVADCLPVTIVDPSSRVAANVHSGWRGAAADIVGRTIAELERLSNFSAAHAAAWLGPAIRACCFEVGEEVVDAFANRYRDVTECVDRSRGERPYFDVARLTRRLLAEHGVTRVLDSGLCTRCGEALFHSYRRDRAAGGRILAITVQA
ncbi:MAG: polyphenol oxidase family protein [Thermoanaerobaculia bacterium]